MFTVLAGLIAQVVEHLLGTKVLPCDFLSVHKALSHTQQLMLTHFDHLSKFALFLIQARILFLLLAKL